ncbi:MAG: hypothetical protein IT307_14600 [Chloroflexi bacterium]|nr:hypothetical protein [Chloroflexota bacterium]
MEQIHRLLEAEAKCFHCGAIAGSLFRSDGDDHPLALFKSASDGRRVEVRHLATLRCDHCGGPLYADEFQVVYRPRLVRNGTGRSQRLRRSA